MLFYGPLLQVFGGKSFSKAIDLKVVSNLSNAFISPLGFVFIIKDIVMDQMNAAQPTDVKVRYHYLDNLRAFAMLAGVLLHVGIGFSVITAELWPFANKEASIFFDYWLWVLHTFRMPLFFLIAGFFAHYIVQHRGLKSFIKNRGVRIAVPFIIFWPLMAGSMFGLMIYAATSLSVDTPVIKLVQFAMEYPDQMNGQEPPVSTTHLWFIYYLVIFSLLTALVCRFVKRGERLSCWIEKPWVLFMVLPLLTALTISRQFTPNPAPESFIPAMWAIAFYGLFYYVGWVFFAKQSILGVIAKAWPYLGVAAIVASLLFCVYLPEPMVLAQAMELMTSTPEMTFVLGLRSILTGLLAWYLSFLCLLGSYRFLNQKNLVLRYIADGSYWVYIVHLPIVFYLQAIFHNKDLPIIVEFCLISAITLGVGYVSYAILVRHTPIGWLLNGRKKPAKVAAKNIGSSSL